MSKRMVTMGAPGMSASVVECIHLYTGGWTEARHAQVLATASRYAMHTTYGLEDVYCAMLILGCGRGVHMLDRWAAEGVGDPVAEARKIERREAGR